MNRIKEIYYAPHWGGEKEAIKARRERCKELRAQGYRVVLETFRDPWHSEKSYILDAFPPGFEGPVIDIVDSTKPSPFVRPGDKK
jgi:hypothetical protein